MAVLTKEEAGVCFLAGVKVNKPGVNIGKYDVHIDDSYADIINPDVVVFCKGDGYRPNNLAPFWGKGDDAFLKEAVGKGVDWIIEQGE